MVSDAGAPGGLSPGELDRWTARKIPPIVVLYLVLVFVGFMLVSFFVFHSLEAVKALAITAVGAVIAILPAVLERVEYRMTLEGIEKRSLNPKKPREFTGVFRWNELDHIVPMRHGFKYVKIMNETRALHRFWKLQISDQFTGEVHVDPKDLERVLDIVRRQGVTL